MGREHRARVGDADAADALEARVIDPAGPLYSRMLVPALALGALALGIAVTTRWDAHLVIAGLIALVLAPLLTGRRRPRQARLVLGAGFVDVRGAGLLRQRIVGRRLRGASTSRLPRGVGLVLQARNRIVALELDTDEAANDVLAALGVGHGGFGWIELDTLPDALAALTRAVRRMALAPAAAGVVWALAGSRVMLVLWTLVSLMLLGLAKALSEPWPRSRLRMERGGLVVWGRGSSPYALDYRAIRWIERTGEQLVLRLRDGAQHTIRIASKKRGLFGHLTHEQAEHLTAQAVAAVERASGLGPIAPDVSESSALLRRGADDARTWLKRLDATASAMRGEPAYRAVPVTRGHLWSALECPDAEADARAGAARILVRLEGPPARSRIDRIAAAALDKTTERRIRIALEPDAERASRELDALEPQPASCGGRVQA